MTVNTLKFGETDFPEVLAQIPAPPAQIYWTGQPPKSWLAKPRVAVVGSRKLTGYGRSVTTKLVTELARAEVVIISGLAYGVDVTAHQSALDAGGLTVAVLPSSLDKVYPPAHLNIARQIVEKGTLVSEYPEGADIAFKSNFIARNRLVSGLADILLITEAAVNSGSLHTARFALEQGKTVMAVPGNITSPISEGCNNLIKSGALPVTDVNDIFFALKLNPAQQKVINFSGSEQEEIVYKLIKEGLADQDQLRVAAQMESPALSSTLTMLEISGYIRPAGGGNWIIT